MSAIDQSVSTNMPDPVAHSPAPTARYWPAVVLVIAYWGFIAISRTLDLPIFGVFMSNMGASALLTLLFVIWWMLNRRIAIGDRLFGFIALVAIGAVTAVLCDPSVGPIGLILFGAPFSVTAWLVWLFVARRSSSAVRRLGILCVLAVVWGCQTLVRVDGIWGDNNASLSWRWSTSAEDRYLADRAKSKQDPIAPAGETAAQELVATDADWVEFRGPNRQGAIYGVTIATDWSADPPKELWRNRIGPAWSSVLVVGDHLFTQEQRGELEVTVCLDATSGKEIWSHEDKARFSDGQAGAGPRATPTFAEGRIYTLGASGILNCLDAATGNAVWTRNIVNDSGAAIPIWGFSSSPLVTQGIVSVYAGAKDEKGMLGYRSETGEPAWNVATGQVSYVSPQLVSIDGQAQVLLLSEIDLVSVEPETGAVLWRHDAPGGVWRVVQPRQIGDHSILIGSEDLGVVRIEVAHDLNGWTTKQAWQTKSIRPAYNDFVVSDGFIYGFDEGIFCAIDLESGKRSWKGGRYGHGQALLIADQRMVLVVTESGEVVLVRANPQKHEELGRFQAVTGKTWNHPVIAHGRLIVRNDEEIACFELRPAATP